jgi:hypothetical protein
MGQGPLVPAPNVAAPQRWPDAENTSICCSHTIESNLVGGSTA